MARNRKRGASCDPLEGRSGFKDSGLAGPALKFNRWTSVSEAMKGGRFRTDLKDPELVAWGSSLSGGRGNGQSGHHLGWGTAQQVGVVEVRAKQIHGLVAAPFPGFVLQFDRGVFSSQVGQSSRPALVEAAAMGRRALRGGGVLQQQDDLDPVARFEFGAPQDDAPICLHCCCFFDRNHGTWWLGYHGYCYLIQSDLARRNSANHILGMGRRVGRVTPCAPFARRRPGTGAHGVTRPTNLTK